MDTIKTLKSEFKEQLDQGRAEINRLPVNFDKKALKKADIMPENMDKAELWYDALDNYRLIDIAGALFLLANTGNHVGRLVQEDKVQTEAWQKVASAEPGLAEIRKLNDLQEVLTKIEVVHKVMKREPSVLSLSSNESIHEAPALPAQPAPPKQEIYEEEDDHLYF